MSYYSNPYGCYDDEDEGPYEPPPCSECGGDYGNHERGCRHGPTWRDHLRQWWMRVYYTPISISTLHRMLKSRFKRKAARVPDEDIPF